MNHHALHDVADVITANRYRFASEDQLQGGIAAALTSAGHIVAREVRLSTADRIDLVVDGKFGIEVKVVGAARRTTTPERTVAQLSRYARTGRFEALLLISTSAKHARMPTSVVGVPLRTVILRGGL